MPVIGFRVTEEEKQLILADKPNDLTVTEYLLGRLGIRQTLSESQQLKARMAFLETFGKPSYLGTLYYSQAIWKVTKGALRYLGPTLVKWEDTGTPYPKFLESSLKYQELIEAGLTLPGCSDKDYLALRVYGLLVSKAKLETLELLRLLREEITHIMETQLGE